MSNFISKETIDAIHNTSDIISIIGEYTALTKRSGNDWWGCCPFHNEKTASFHVDGDKKFYYCFGCHASGDVIKFITEIEKLSYVEAVSLIAKKSNIEIIYSDNFQKDFKSDDLKKDLYIDLYERVASLFHYFLTQTDMGKNALSYIVSRGVTKKEIEKFKLGYAPKDKKWLKDFLRKKNFSDDFLAKSGLFSKNYNDIAFFSDRLMFPIFNRRGQCVAFGGRILNGDGPKYLNSSDLIQYKKGETLYAFNFAKNAIRENKKVIFCEGYMDCIAYHQCGILYATAPLGTSLTENQLRIVRGFADTILLSFDSDKAGMEATMRAIILCRQFDFTVKIIKIEGGKDPAEILKTYGSTYLTNSVNNAMLDSDYLLSRLSEDFIIDSPEGKAKASLEFFRYVDSLKSDIQKQSCLEQLCQAFNLKMEAVKRDFKNREYARERLKSLPKIQQSKQNYNITLDAELRTVLAVVADINQFEVMRSQLTADDFQNALAKKLFIILDDCFKENSMSVSSVLDKCDDENLREMISHVISSGEFSQNNNRIIEDSIQLIKRNALERKRGDIINEMRSFNPATQEEKNYLEKLLTEKMELDKILKQ